MRLALHGDAGAVDYVVMDDKASAGVIVAGLQRSGTLHGANLALFTLGSYLL